MVTDANVIVAVQLARRDDPLVIDVAPIRASEIVKPVIAIILPPNHRMLARYP
jgi:hypothetical protein